MRTDKMADRKNLTHKLRNEILISNRHSCCICVKDDVQIHHINGGNSDNRLRCLTDPLRNKRLDGILHSSYSKVMRQIKFKDRPRDMIENC